MTNQNTNHPAPYRMRYVRKTAAAACGFLAGVITMPIAACLYPFALAWFIWHEEED